MYSDLMKNWLETMDIYLYVDGSPRDSYILSQVNQAYS